jgi:hypothetical protein
MSHALLAAAAMPMHAAQPDTGHAAGMEHCPGMAGMAGMGDAAGPRPATPPDASHPAPCCSMGDCLCMMAGVNVSLPQPMYDVAARRAAILGPSLCVDSAPLQRSLRPPIR